MKIIKLLLCALFGLGLTIILPFTSASGLDYVKAHGKLLLFAIGVVNVFLSGGICGGFLDAGFKTGFSYWTKPFYKDGDGINPTHGFAAIFLLINLFVIIWGIEP